MIDKEAFAKVLSTHLEQSGEKITELAQRIKIPASTLRSYVAGATTPSFQNIHVIAQSMGMTIEQLLRLGDPPTDQIGEIKSLIEGEKLDQDAKKELIRYLLDSL